MLAVSCLLAAVGCYDGPTGPPHSKPTTRAKPVADTPVPLAGTRKKIAKGVYLEINGKRRRVLVDAHVCLREGSYGLETFLCRSGTKEHESVLATDADARMIHAALIACGGEPGHPVRFFENKPPETPTGSRILVSVDYKEDGKEHTVRAQDWVLNVQTRKPLAKDWVFAGSFLYKDPDEPKAEPRYVANGDGAYICVNNVPTAMLDLPIKSANAPEARIFSFNTPKIPPIGTKVTVILEPKK